MRGELMRMGVTKMVESKAGLAALLKSIERGSHALERWDNARRFAHTLSLRIEESAHCELSAVFHDDFAAAEQYAAERAMLLEWQMVLHVKVCQLGELLREVSTEEKTARLNSYARMLLEIEGAA